MSAGGLPCLLIGGVTHGEVGEGVWYAEELESLSDEAVSFF